MRFHSSFDPRFSCGIGNFEIVGVDVTTLSEHLWNKHRIFTTVIKHPQFQGLRVTPSVSTTLEEIDRFVGVVDGVVRHGLPA